MLSALRPEPDENTQPVPVKPYINTGNIRLHTSQSINNPHGLKAPRTVDLIKQQQSPFRQFNA
jgi:hypothetical protein